MKHFSGCIVAVVVASCLGLNGCADQSEKSLLESARSHLTKGDTPAAIIQLKTALQKNPSSAEARFLLGKAQLEGGDPVSALGELRKARDLKHPDDVVIPALARAMLDLGQMKKLVDEFAGYKLADRKAVADLETSIAVASLALGQPKQADAALTKAVEAEPTYARAKLLQALMKAGTADYDGALRLIASVTAAEPSNAEARLLEGSVLRYGKGDLEGAMQAYRKALQARKGYVAAHSEIIGLYLQKKDTEGAAKQLAELKASTPHSVQTAYFDAELAFIRQDYKAAKELLQQLLRVSPDNWRLLLLAGANELQLNSLVQSEAYLNKVVQQQPELATARNLLARTSLAAGKSSRALEVLRPVLDLENPGAETLSLAAEAHLQGGDLANAEALFSRAAKASPGNPEIRTAQAMTQFVKGRADVAIPELVAIASTDKGTVADLALVNAHLRRNELDAALAAVDGVERKQPGKPLAMNLRGRVLLLKRDYAGARQNFERALALAPAYLPAAQSLAELDLKENKPDLAWQRYEAILKADPKSVGALMGMAALKARTGGTVEEVASLIRNAQAANTADVTPSLMLIEHYIGAGDARQAATVAQQAAATFPDHPGVLEALGRTQALVGDTQQAMSAFGKLAILLPKSPLPYLRMAEIQRSRKDFDAAAQNIRRALEIKPDLLTAQQALIGLALKSNQPAKALAVARVVQQQRPNDAIGLVLEGDIEVGRKNWTAAMVAYRAALKLPANADTAAKKLHMSLTMANKADDAAVFAVDWMKAHPKDVGFLLQLGGMALGKGDMAEAERRYRDVLAIQPDEAFALNNIAWTMLRQGKKGALAYAEKAVALMPNSVPFMDTLALVLVDEGQLDRAIEVQKKVVALAPKDPSVGLNLARIYLKAGKKEQAAAELDTLAKLGDKFREQDEVERLRKSLASK